MPKFPSSSFPKPKKKRSGCLIWIVLIAGGLFLFNNLNKLSIPTEPASSSQPTVIPAVFGAETSQAGSTRQPQTNNSSTITPTQTQMVVTTPQQVIVVVVITAMPRPSVAPDPPNPPTPTPTRMPVTVYPTATPTPGEYLTFVGTKTPKP